MSDELSLLLLIIAVGMPVGAAIGVALRKHRPGWCKRYAKFCLNRPWKVYAMGVVLFAFLGAMMFAQGRPYFGAFFVVLCGFQTFMLFRYGFRRLTPEMERRIDESDPTKLWLVCFWKQKDGERSTEEAGRGSPTPRARGSGDG